MRPYVAQSTWESFQVKMDFRLDFPDYPAFSAENSIISLFRVGGEGKKKTDALWYVETTGELRGNYGELKRGVSFFSPTSHVTFVLNPPSEWVLAGKLQNANQSKREKKALRSSARPRDIATP